MLAGEAVRFEGSRHRLGHLVAGELQAHLRLRSLVLARRGLAEQRPSDGDDRHVQREPAWLQRLARFAARA